MAHPVIFKRLKYNAGFAVKGITCASGYSGTVTVTKCNPDYSVSGCSKAVSSVGELNGGYNPRNNRSLILVLFALFLCFLFFLISFFELF